VDNSATFYGDGGVLYRLVWVPSGKGGGSWVLAELKYERPPRRWRRKGPASKSHRPVTRHR
jgi:hypothetical protein